MKYMIINPLNGGYNITEDESMIDSIVYSTAMELYLNHTHNLPIMTMIDNDDGTVSIEPYGEYSYKSVPGEITIITNPDKTGFTPSTPSINIQN